MDGIDSNHDKNVLAPTCHERNSKARYPVQPFGKPSSHLASIVYLIFSKLVRRYNRRPVSNCKADKPKFWRKESYLLITPAIQLLVDSARRKCHAPTCV